MIYDISLPLSENLPVWPGDARLQRVHTSELSAGDSATVSRLTLSAHTGTHVDAPAHFIPDGAGVDSLNLDVLVGPARVVEALEVETLSADVLSSLPIPTDTPRILFHTRNSAYWARGEQTFQKDFVGIPEDGARWLVERGVRLVGIDYLSVAPFTASIPTHHVLLRAGVIAVEGLNLSGVPAGEYQLVCLPLKLVGSDGAPARAVLINEHS
jgi:arylformamidase